MQGAEQGGWAKGDPINSPGFISIPGSHSLSGGRMSVFGAQQTDPGTQSSRRKRQSAMNEDSRQKLPWGMPGGSQGEATSG